MPYSPTRARRPADRGNLARKRLRSRRLRAWKAHLHPHALTGDGPDDGGYGDGLGIIESTDTLLYKQLHQAAVDAYQAKVAGNKAAEAAARSRMAAIGAAYRSAGHTQDELDYIQAHPFATPNPLSWLQGLGLGGILVAGGALMLLARRGVRV